MASSPSKRRLPIEHDDQLLQHLEWLRHDPHLTLLLMPVSNNVETRTCLQAAETNGKDFNLVPSLIKLSQKAVIEGLNLNTVCSALSMVDLLHPALDEVAPILIEFLARNLEGVLDKDAKGFEDLPASLLAEMLGNPCLVSPHRSISLLTAMTAVAQQGLLPIMLTL